MNNFCFSHKGVYMQNLVKEFNDNNPKFKRVNIDVCSRLFELVNETGHLAGEYLKITNYNSKNFKLDCNFETELGDVFYSLISLSNDLGVDIEKVLNLTLNKFKIRCEKFEAKTIHNEDAFDGDEGKGQFKPKLSESIQNCKDDYHADGNEYKIFEDLELNDDDK